MMDCHCQSLKPTIHPSTQAGRLQHQQSLYATSFSVHDARALCDTHLLNATGGEQLQWLIDRATHTHRQADRPGAIGQADQASNTAANCILDTVYNLTLARCRPTPSRYCVLQRLTQDNDLLYYIRPPSTAIKSTPITHANLRVPMLTAAAVIGLKNSPQHPPRNALVDTGH